MYDPNTACVSFAGNERIAQGPLVDVARATKERIDAGEAETILIFDAKTSRHIEVDFRGSVAEVVERLSAGMSEGPRGRGRPKLGVVGKEVTLLPRHWEWLDAQPGGASVTLRKLVEHARRDPAVEVREAQESAYRFMLAVAGNQPGFEAAIRSLYAGRASQFAESTEAWPCDVREHAQALAAPTFSGQGA